MLLREVTDLGEHYPLDDALRSGQRPTSELIDSYRISNTPSELGACGGLSRAAFARRFTALVGRPPLAYLTWWRMTIAARLLRDDDAPLATIAARTGYTSEFACGKAFKREYGSTPGEYRRSA